MKMGNELFNTVIVASVTPLIQRPAEIYGSIPHKLVHISIFVGMSYVPICFLSIHLVKFPRS
jgi:hypothetical protein